MFISGKLNTCGSNKEFQALKEQIAADEQANSVLADEILEALERLDELSLQVEAAEERSARIGAEADKTKHRVTEEQQTLRGELDRVQGELVQAEAALPADFRREYRRIADVRGESALAQATSSEKPDPPARPVTQTSLPALETNHKLCLRNEEAPDEL